MTHPRVISRRSVLAGIALLPAAVPLLTRAAAGAQTSGGASPYGALQPPDSLGLMLPEGFTARVLARAGEVVPTSSYEWHIFPDGGATFAVDDGGWVYASNSEMPAPGAGGAGALRFDADGEVVDAYPILTGTMTNCAGGATPWDTWLSCEEHDAGQVYECDPFQRGQGEVRPALGRFSHEAAAVDPGRGHVYLTEDEPDGRFYRFTPDRPGDLSAGGLEVARVLDDDTVEWLALTDPDAATTPTRLQVAASTAFAGGEGIWFADDEVVFVTKLDQKLWSYDIATSRLRVLHDALAVTDAPVIDGPDNITISAFGDIIVCEDHGGEPELVIVTADGVVAPILRQTGEPATELAGAAFDPSGTRLYVSSQRARGGGITYEIAGPFRQPTPPSTTTIATDGGTTAAADDGDDDGWALPALGGAAAALAVGAGAWWLRTRRGALGSTATDPDDSVPRPPA
ncbi:MAG TPA: alkaline phosphatase PhoX [Acidimicrobiia bacterium]|nr:alkaline phosphatase PhoX [Acidimicrobiia bacterium]